MNWASQANQPGKIYLKIKFVMNEVQTCPQVKSNFLSIANNYFRPWNEEISPVIQASLTHINSLYKL